VGVGDETCDLQKNQSAGVVLKPLPRTALTEYFGSSLSETWQTTRNDGFNFVGNRV
jgi:hypothetical protein